MKTELLAALERVIENFQAHSYMIVADLKKSLIAYDNMTVGDHRLYPYFIENNYFYRIEEDSHKKERRRCGGPIIKTISISMKKAWGESNFADLTIGIHDKPIGITIWQTDRKTDSIPVNKKANIKKSKHQKMRPDHRVNEIVLAHSKKDGIQNFIIDSLKKDFRMTFGSNCVKVLDLRRAVWGYDNMKFQLIKDPKFVYPDDLQNSTFIYPVVEHNYNQLAFSLHSTMAATSMIDIIGVWDKRHRILDPIEQPANTISKPEFLPLNLPKRTNVVENEIKTEYIPCCDKKPNGFFNLIIDRYFQDDIKNKKIILGTFLVTEPFFETLGHCKFVNLMDQHWRYDTTTFSLFYANNANSLNDLYLCHTFPLERAGKNGLCLYSNSTGQLHLAVLEYNFLKRSFIYAILDSLLESKCGS